MPPVVTRERETRFLEGAEIRMEADESHISGYLARFDVWSEKIMWFRERVRPGAFTKTLQESDVRCTFNHTPSLILGRMSAKTMEVSEDAVGLRFRTKLPDTSYARDLRESIKRGDVTGCSFTFDVIKDSWSEDQKERDLSEVRLYEGGPVTFPAYPQTEVSVRAALMSSGIELADVLAVIKRTECWASRDRRSIEEAIATLRSYLPADEPVSEDHSAVPSVPEPARDDHSGHAYLRMMMRRLDIAVAESEIERSGV